jgi:hypothetical protein
MSLRYLSSFIINNKTKNHCVNCINYINYKYIYPHDEIYESETKLGNCSLFGKQHLVTGEFEYDKALICRTNENKCGKEGQYYSKINKK